MKNDVLAVGAERADAEEHVGAACDLCGASESRLVAEASPRRCRTVICRECGLLRASPGLSVAEMDRLYEGFQGDAGSDARAVGGRPAEHRLRIEEKRAANWALEIVRRHLPVKGQRLLELRCRSGALAASLVADGAAVVGVDPFTANLRVAAEDRGLTDVVLLPISRFHRLELPDPEPFDAVIALTEHVMSHVLSPREFLESVLERLKPGGLLILDEKDVLQPRHFYSDGPFDTGRLHQYHLTRRTLESYVLAAGFEIVACEIDPKRKSIQRHIHLVARKPETGPVVRDSPWLREPGPQVDTTLRRLRWLQRTWALQRARAGAGRSLRRLFRAGG